MQIYLSNFAFFSVKSPSVTQRLVSQENACKKSLNLLPYFDKTGSNNSFTSTWNQFQVKLAKIEFNVIVHYGLWAKCIQFSPLKMFKSETKIPTNVGIFVSGSDKHCWFCFGNLLKYSKINKWSLVLNADNTIITSDMTLSNL